LQEINSLEQVEDWDTGVNMSFSNNSIRIWSSTSNLHIPWLCQQ